MSSCRLRVIRTAAGLLAPWAWGLHGPAAAHQPGDNPVAAYYATGEGYPAWTDAIRWSNVVDMKQYAKGKTGFEKFENARDELAAKGGGVLYYPAGAYNFSAGPFDGPQGRGLMLRSGVVIRGQAPPREKASAMHGGLELPTRFVFGFKDRSAAALDYGERLRLLLKGAVVKRGGKGAEVRQDLRLSLRATNRAPTDEDPYAVFGSETAPCKVRVVPGSPLVIEAEVTAPVTGKYRISGTLGQEFSGSYENDTGAKGEVSGKVMVNLPETPRDWNLIGLQPEPGKRIKDVDYVGVCWVHLVGTSVYFGPDLAWGPSRKDGRSNRSVCVKPSWAGRKPDGTHPYDPKMAGPMSPGSNGGRYPDGSPFNGLLGVPKPLDGPGYVGAGKGRLVFGCVLEDSCVVNDHDTRGRLEAREGFGLDGFHMARYAARVQVYGSRVFVANNCLPMSGRRNFKYGQTTVRTEPARGNDFRLLDTRKSTVLSDYNRVMGIDVNKDLLALLQSELLNRDAGGFFQEGVAVLDSFVFNHGHKGFSASGKWCVLQNNRNERVFLKSGEDPCGLGGWRLTLDGFTESAAGGGGMISDNYCRAFDVCGRCLWIDGNSYNNLGSSPGNDGEAICRQLHAGTHYHSWAVTRNRFDPDSRKGSICAFDVDMLGALVAWNQATELGFMGRQTRRAFARLRRQPSARSARLSGGAAPAGRGHAGRARGCQGCRQRGR
jgi:hypothetical protein